MVTTRCGGAFVEFSDAIPPRLSIRAPRYQSIVKPRRRERRKRNRQVQPGTPTLSVLEQDRKSLPVLYGYRLGAPRPPVPRHGDGIVSAGDRIGKIDNVTSREVPALPLVARLMDRGHRDDE